MRYELICTDACFTRLFQVYNHKFNGRHNSFFHLKGLGDIDVFLQFELMKLSRAELSW